MSERERGGYASEIQKLTPNIMKMSVNFYFQLTILSVPVFLEPVAYSAIGREKEVQLTTQSRIHAEVHRKTKTEEAAQCYQIKQTVIVSCC